MDYTIKPTESSSMPESRSAGVGRLSIAFLALAAGTWGYTMVGRLGVLSMSSLTVVAAVAAVAFVTVVIAVVTMLLGLILVRVSMIPLADVDRVWFVVDRLDTGGRLLNETSVEGP